MAACPEVNTELLLLGTNFLAGLSIFSSCLQVVSLVIGGYWYNSPTSYGLVWSVHPIILNVKNFAPSICHAITIPRAITSVFEFHYSLVVCPKLVIVTILIGQATYVQEEVGIGADGLEETVSKLEPYSLFGEISILCNIPQPYTVRVCELCRLLRLDKQSFSNILDIYFNDGRRILNNLLQVI